MRKILPKNASTWMAISLGLAAVSVVVVEIATASETRTALESSLFNVLQFVFSVGFAWVIARIASRREFSSQQRQFAVAAYRRIHEVDRSLERLLTRITNQLPVMTGQALHELEVILAICTGIKETTQSSMADWGDVIGEELVTLKRIAKIKIRRDGLLEDPKQLHRAETIVEEKIPQAMQDRLDELVESLPYSLRAIAEGERGNVEDVHARLVDESIETRKVSFDAFWDSTFDRHIREVETGQDLLVDISDVADRTGIFVIRDTEGRTVGMIPNSFGYRYHEFVEGTLRFLRKSRFKVILTAVDEQQSTVGRVYFTVQLHEIPEFVRRTALPDSQSPTAASRPSS